MEREVVVSGHKKMMADNLRALANELEVGREAQWYIPGNGMEEQPNLVLRFSPSRSPRNSPCLAWNSTRGGRVP